MQYLLYLICIIMLYLLYLMCIAYLLCLLYLMCIPAMSAVLAVSIIILPDVHTSTILPAVLATSAVLLCSCLECFLCPGFAHVHTQVALFILMYGSYATSVVQTYQLTAAYWGGPNNTMLLNSPMVCEP